MTEQQPTHAQPDESFGAVHESRDWLRVTLGCIGDAVITTDAAGSVTFLNPAAQTLTGWSNEQAAGVALPLIFNIVNESTREVAENPALRALREGLIVGLANHSILISRDLTERPIDDNAAPIRNSSGEIAGAVLVFRDIGPRRQAEAVVRASEEQYRALFTSIDEGFAVIEMLLGADGSFDDYRFLETNPAFAKQSGLRNAVGKRMRELLPNLEVHWVEALAKVAISGEPIRVVDQVKELGDRWFDVYAFRIGTPQMARVAIVCTDITQRKQLEIRLKESEVRYRRLFQTAKDGILILDAHTGKIIDANAFMSALVGLDAHEMLGKELYEIGMYADIEENKDAFRELQQTRYLRHEHLPVQNQRGEKVEVEFIANVYTEGQRLVAQCNVRDISERVAMQDKIAEQAETLAGESRRKDEFLAMLSHELRNPLAPIRSAIHLLKTQQRGSENPIQKQAHAIIERQVGNLTRLVGDLLEVSRVLSGRVRLNQHINDLNEVVRHAIDTARPLIDQCKHELIVHCCDDSTWVNIDAARMEDVFVNLLNNAAKYTPAGGRIELYCEHPRGRNYAQVRIRDNGVGIDAELLSGGRIFDLFTQADRTLDRSQGGLGIGLSLARRLVDLHGGTLEATSPPEGSAVGSEFVVQLPLMPEPLVPNGKPEPGRDDPSQPSAGRVLVVDDNVDLVLMLATLLEQQGYAVRSAYNGPDGLQLAQLWRPEIVLLDIGLPGLDGYEVARQLRADPRMATMRLIALTGYGQEGDTALARDAGFDAHLTKPYDFDDLAKLMRAPAE